METIAVVVLWLFAITHIDTYLVMSAFCADIDYQLREVFAGHFIGFCAGLVAAVIGAVLAAELLEAWTFLLGVVPLSLGLWGLVRQSPETTVEESTVVPDSLGRIGVVTGAGFGLSGENIAVFVPFFTELSIAELTLVVFLYVIGAIAVFLAAFVSVSRFRAEGMPAWVDRWLVPSVLVLVGGYVLVSPWVFA